MAPLAAVYVVPLLAGQEMEEVAAAPVDVVLVVDLLVVDEAAVEDEVAAEEEAATEEVEEDTAEELDDELVVVFEAVLPVEYNE